MLIDDYSFGRIRVDGKTYRGDVIIYPDHVDGNWWRKEGHSLQTEDISGILCKEPAVLVIGTGKFGLMKVRDDVREFLESRGIELISDKTDAACKVHNNLIGSGRKTITALHLTC